VNIDLAAIEARAQAAIVERESNFLDLRQFAPVILAIDESSTDVPALLALVREQQAVIAKLSDWAGRNKSGYYDEAQDDVVQIIRAAITATEATK